MGAPGTRDNQHRRAESERLTGTVRGSVDEGINHRKAFLTFLPKIAENKHVAEDVMPDGIKQDGRDAADNPQFWVRRLIRWSYDHARCRRENRCLAPQSVNIATEVGNHAHQPLPEVANSIFAVEYACRRVGASGMGAGNAPLGAFITVAADLINKQSQSNVIAAHQVGGEQLQEKLSHRKG